MFEGFSKDTVRFLSGLSRNNSKAWFEDHRADYDEHVMAPAVAFVEAIGPRLSKIDPSVRAVPKVNGSIMRIHRDVRFSKDKSPYKDHLDLWFWSGDDKGWDKSGFFFRLTPTRLMLGAGMHGFMPPVLARYRESVLDQKKGPALAKVVAKLHGLGLEIGGETYKKTPRGVAEDHPRASLMKHSGLYAGWEAKHPKELGSRAFLDLVAKRYATMAPLHEWLSKALLSR
jgi:uncharacterized protein (TIGR02453 family)